MSLAKPQKPAQQLTNTLTTATRAATEQTRVALKKVSRPNEALANELLHQNYAVAVAGSAAVKAGQVFGPSGTKQIQAINQALATAFLQPAGRTANIEDLRDLARYRTQLLADLTDAGSNPARRAEVKAKLAAAYALAQKAAVSTGREKAGALYALPQAVVPYKVWSATYNETALNLAVTGSTRQVKTIGDTLSHDMLGSGVGELPALGAGIVGAVLGIRAMNRAGGPRAQPQGGAQPLPQRGTPARPASETGTRSEYEQAQQQARASAYKYDAKKVTSNQLFLDVNPNVRTGETPQQAAARVQAANAELRARFPKIGQVDGLLKDVRPHVVGNDFLARAERGTGGQISLQTGSAAKLTIPAPSGVVVEPIPGSTGKPIGRFEFYNTPGGPRSGFLSGPGTILPSSGGYNIKFLTEIGKTPQNRPKYGEAAQWKAGTELPEGYRYQLVPGDMKNSGFSGGHSTEAWNQTLRTYGDQININKAATKSISYKTSPIGNLDTASQYTYSFGGRAVKQPKTVGGSAKTLEALEPAIANQVGKFLDAKPSLVGNQVIVVKIPVLNRSNKTIMLPIDVRIVRDPATGTLEIKSWYLNANAFNIGSLK
ncbi:hypothetical protein [Deinococcus multiflagellatus]|uniref:Pre-toxin TG domain-containing protein n=1 Tax=Deinococcus multiflagellatus TaxID=1656887 RepID=A0ABW1ZFP2_9DEIO|nr:hypothetical protein [Deinococcus multiflagellatus]MBZ9713020.1 hypothetical protein [Deinococcus multiflagellatus]